MLQSSTISASPVQSLLDPVLQERVRVLLPPPQVREQLSQAPHASHAMKRSDIEDGWLRKYQSILQVYNELHVDTSSKNI